MTTKARWINVSDLTVEVVRKKMKNLYIRVYPPDGRVRVTAPRTITDDAVRLAVVRRLDWINRQRGKFQSQGRQPTREMMSGEGHFFLGRLYRLRVIEQTGHLRVEVGNGSYIDMRVRPDTSPDRRAQLLEEWYREQLSELIPQLIEKWESALNVKIASWGIKRMKTRWGSCNVAAQRIWLNLELAKKPVECLEYVILHEMAHLLERHHNGRFTSLMDEYLPQWRAYRDELNTARLENEARERSS